MDSKNLFETKNTFTLIRLEYLSFICVILYFIVLKHKEISWGAFIGFFAIVDIIGYLPGAIAFRLSKSGSISKVFYLLYNVMHSFITTVIIIVVWCLWVTPEWALLALPLHLCGDRAIFGNFIKPFSTLFEPSVHPAFAKFITDYPRYEGERKKGAS